MRISITIVMPLGGPSTVQPIGDCLPMLKRMHFGVLPMTDPTPTTKGPLDYVQPTVAQVAHALCMSGCAVHGMGGCTWNGITCEDVSGFEDEAKTLLRNAR